MNQEILKPGEYIVIQKGHLGTILYILQEDGYQLVGPTVYENAITYREIDGVEDLPIGWRDEHSPARYHVKDQADGTYFGYLIGPDSPKRYLYPPRLNLFSTTKNGGSSTIQAGEDGTPRYAFIGIRACDIAAIHVQDRVFIEGAIEDPTYTDRRVASFVLAVNCTEPAPTCFCASMETGPKCTKGFDLAVTELKDCFLIEIGSTLGAQVVRGLDYRLASARELDLAEEAIVKAENSMGAALDTMDLNPLLLDNLDHPRWDEVASRCLSCTNCTMVCPTCFCSDIVDVSDLKGEETSRIRVWDSCFNPDFSYVYGGQLRPNVRSRYRQWLTHKLASWSDQYGVIGCVGCGRCITWCPAGIDLREEVTAIRGEV